MESYTGDVKERYYGRIEEIWELDDRGFNTLNGIHPFPPIKPSQK